MRPPTPACGPREDEFRRVLRPTPSTFGDRRHGNHRAAQHGARFHRVIVGQRLVPAPFRPRAKAACGAGALLDDRALKLCKGPSDRNRATGPRGWWCRSPGRGSGTRRLAPKSSSARTSCLSDRARRSPFDTTSTGRGRTGGPVRAGLPSPQMPSLQKCTRTRRP